MSDTIDEPEDEALTQTDGDKTSGLMDMLQSVGIDPQDVAAVIGQLVKAQMAQDLPAMLDVAFSQHADAIASQIASRMPAAPANGKSAGSDALLQLIMTKMAGGQAQAVGGELGGLQTASKALGDVFNNLLTPIMGIYAQGEQAAMQKIRTYSQTGGTLPWEGTRAPTADPRTADDVARAIKVDTGDADGSDR